MPRRLSRVLQILEAFTPMAGETLESKKSFLLFAFWRIRISFCFGSLFFCVFLFLLCSSFALSCLFICFVSLRRPLFCVLVFSPGS